jgi:AcrR family transcriptional regulator
MARPADPNARSALIAAARHQFVKHGIRGARIEDITAACGLSKGAFYLHFESKELLFKELVSEFRAHNDALLTRRKESMAAFFMEHGPLNGRDVQKKTPRYEKFLELGAGLDRDTLSMLWDYRDVFGVLVSGSQGTEFQGMVWQMAQAEIQRVQESFEAMKAVGACRTDVPSELFGSMMVGTWLLIAQQMSRLKTRPDLDQWVEALHRLIHEGSAPQTQARGRLKVARRVA